MEVEQGSETGEHSREWSRGALMGVEQGCEPHDVREITCLGPAKVLAAGLEI